MKVPSTIPKLLVQGRRRYVSLAAKSAQSQVPNPSQSLRSDSTSSSWSSLHASAVASALLLAGAVSSFAPAHAEMPSANTTNNASSVLGTSSTVTQAEPVRQPRNVMLHRMRSAAGRGLNDKYKVDWKTVLGGKVVTRNPSLHQVWKFRTHFSQNSHFFL